jgi:hypothetical protein
LGIFYIHMFNLFSNKHEQELVSLRAKLNRFSDIKMEQEETIGDLREEIENLKISLAFEAGKLKREREKVALLREALLPYCTCVIPSATVTAINALAATEDTP